MPKVDQLIKCVSCGASIQGADTQGTCSACGASVEETLRHVGVDPVLMNVSEDVICLHCGYNLRSIPISGVCPECGEAVVTSLRMDDLRGADRAWLQRVRSGMTLIIISILSGIGMYLLFMVAMIAKGFTTAAQTQNGTMTVVSTVGWIVLWILFCVGLFKATASDPSASAPNLSNIYRNLARTCAVLPVLMMPFTGYLAWQMNVSPATAMSFIGQFFNMMMLAGGFSVMMYGVCAICLTVCIRRLFHRARHIGIRRLATVQIVLLSCVTLIGAAGMTIMAITMGPILSSPAMTRAMTATPSSTSPLPGARVTTPAPGIVVEDYTMADQQKSVQVGNPTTSSAPAGMPSSVPPIFGTPAGARTMVISLTLLMITYCGGGLIFLACLIIGVILLFRCRSLLTDVLAL